MSGRGEGGVRGRLKPLLGGAWVSSWEGGRAAGAEEQARRRILASATWLIVLLVGGYVFALWRAGTLSSALLELSLGSSAILLGVLALARSRAPFWVPALMLCTLLTSGYVLAALLMDNPRVFLHVAVVLPPVMAFLLLGARGGLLFAVLIGVASLVIQPLCALKLFAGRSVPTDPPAWFEQGVASVSVLGLFMSSWLHSRARDTTQKALRHTLQSLGEEERKLSSLVESTGDVVCSLDARGRLLIANTTARDWFALRHRPPPRPGQEDAAEVLLRDCPQWQEYLSQALGGSQVRFEALHTQPAVAMDWSLTPIRDERGHSVGVTLFGRDITERHEAEARLGELHRHLLESSRKAGMAEIATGVLHNVGNALNSINISVVLLTERLGELRGAQLLQATQLLREHAADPGAFLTQNARGRLLPDYLVAAASSLLQVQSDMQGELQSLMRHLDHVKAVVHMQQEHARYVGMVEEVEVDELLDDALRLHGAAFEGLGIQVWREYELVPPIRVDRHKLMQILVNLLNNARQALLEGEGPERRLTLRVRRHEEGRLCIEVADNGVGIAPENLERLFTHGFTTRREGHGFGLHSSALAAAELEGQLSCRSAGRGQGATFTLLLPMRTSLTPA